jgi:hypothetical protein
MTPFTPLAAVLISLFLSTAVMANPSMLPKHEGYPMGKATDPVSGRALTNDAGQMNATGDKALQKSAMAEDGHVRQQLVNPSDQRILEKPGAGLLPKVQGPQIKIEPPVKEASRTPANPQ